MESQELVLEEQVVTLSLTDLAPNPWNPHSSSIDELRLISDSIRELGQLVPLLVVHWDKAVSYEDKEYLQAGKYMIVDGEQRYKALTQLFAEGDNRAMNVRAIIIGSASDYEGWELAELGQAANHARSKTEDDVKTGRLMSEILKHRSVQDYSKIVGQRQDYLSKTMELLKNREARAVKPALSKKPEMVPRATATRGYYTVSLPFESAEEVEEFEGLLSQLPSAGKSYKGLERSYRVLDVLRKYFEA